MRLHDAERYEVLTAVYGREGTTVNHEDVGAYRTKTVYAGETLYISAYPLIGPHAYDAAQAGMAKLRGDKSPRSTVKFARYNNSRRMLQLEQLTETNFVPGDLHITATYGDDGWADMDKGHPDPEMYARDRDMAKREVRNYLRRVKRLLKRNGADLNDWRWICVTVTKVDRREHDPPYPDRHHHHILMHGVPESLRTDVEKLWPYGYCNADRMQPRKDKGLADLAQYVARQEGSANGLRGGERSFSCSKNIKRPEVRTSDRKLSRRRVMQMAADVRQRGREIFEALYPGYRVVPDEVSVKLSDFVAGAYIYAKMRKRGGPGNVGAKKPPDPGTGAPRKGP